MAAAEQATWQDVKSAQADIAALRVRMMTLAEDQADATGAGIKAAIGKLEAAGKRAENPAHDVSHANAALFDPAQRAAQSLSSAVVGARSKLVDAIAPKKVEA